MQGRDKHLDKRPGYPATVPGFLTPPVLWALYFVAIYSIHGMVCAGGFEGVLINVATLASVIVLITLIVFLGQAVVGYWAYRVWRNIARRPEADERDPLVRASFLTYAALLNAGLFMVATVWVGVPALMLEPCL